MNKSTNTSRVHPEILKYYASPIYRQKVKKVVEDLKELKGIPWGKKLPGRPNRLAANASEGDRDRAAKINNYRADRETAHYFAQTIEAGSDRRAQEKQSVES